MRTRRRWTKVVAIIIAVVSIVIFVVTENIFLPMKLTRSIYNYYVGIKSYPDCYDYHW
ncbi:MAG: hypothetical protein ACLSBH_21195 [Coprobacillus cateniformis]